MPIGDPRDGFFYPTLTLMMVLIFHMPVPAENGTFWYIILFVMLLIYTRGIIRFWNCDGLSRMVHVVQGVSSLVLSSETD